MSCGVCAGSLDHDEDNVPISDLQKYPHTEGHGASVAMAESAAVALAAAPTLATRMQIHAYSKCDGIHSSFIYCKSN